MGLGLGGMGFLLVLGVRGRDDDAPRDPASSLVAVAPSATTPELHHVDDAAARGDASPVDGGLVSDAVADVEPPPPPPPPVFRVASLAGETSLAFADGTMDHRPFLTALAAAGVTRTESYRVLRAIAPLHDLNHTSPADTFHLAKEKGSGRVVAFEYVTSPVDVFQARDQGGTLDAKKLDLHIDAARVATAVTVGADLHASLKKAGFEDDMLQRLDDALDGHAELSDVHPGSRLRILATEERLAGVFLRYAALDALEYTGATRGATTLRLYRFPPLDKDKLPVAVTTSTTSGAQGAHATHSGSYYDAKGQEPYHGGWRIPVPGARIASRFNPHRMHPTLHVVMPHNGVDFAAPTGTPIYAAASGIVKTAGDSGPCGNMVQIEHNAGIISSYCHMSRFASGMHVGEHVDTRQLIGYVGQTGRATGPHCHFAIKRNGVFIDPLAMKLDGVRVVPPSQRDEFEALRGVLDKALDAIVMDPPLPGAEPAEPEARADAGADGGGEDQIFDEVVVP
jgi:murein DD-endopeptidase MepM/ murein hydrolase activator NlpD